LVEEEGEYAHRGGIIDFYSPLYSYPIRVELLGESIESIREFDPLTQSSIKKREEAILCSRNEMALAKKLGIATIVEIAAYFIPWVDNLLDTIAIPLAAVAGTAIMVATVADLSPAITWALAIIAGGGTATAVQTSTSTARLASTATTGGVANPIISTVETGTSIVMSILAIFTPVFAILVVLIIFWILFKIYKRIKSKKE